MSINIHGREYVTVAERVKAIHEAVEHFSITTEVLQHEPLVIVKATVTLNYIDKTDVFTGISAANPDKAIEKQSPYEVAETSAVGRALGFAGYGVVDGIATAEEMVKANVVVPINSKATTTPELNLDDLTPESFADVKEPLRDSMGKTTCSVCGKQVSKKVEEFSMDKFGKVLCMEHQKAASV